MAKAVLKTTMTEANVSEFLAALPDPKRREEGELLDALHRRITGCEPKLWGPSIVGYGHYRYKYASGREGDWMRAGFSPRKAAATVYLMGTFTGDRKVQAEALFSRLGQHTLGKSCLYLKHLDKIDMAVLETLIRLSWDTMNKAWPD